MCVESQFSSLEFVKQVMRYLANTKQMSLHCGGKNASIVTNLFVDADWTGDSETRKSMSGCVVIMGGGAVRGYAPQQEVVTL